MNINSSALRTNLRPGLSLIELTVVISILLLLITVFQIGASAFKSGADRASCVLNIQQVQKGVRSFSNLNGLEAGASVDEPESLRSFLVGESGVLQADPQCPGGGTYEDQGDLIPVRGELYLSCSLASRAGHVPANRPVW